MQKNWTQVQKKLSIPAHRLTNKHLLQRPLNQASLAWTLCFINYPSQKQKIITAAIRSSFNECLILGWHWMKGSRRPTKYLIWCLKLLIWVSVVWEARWLVMEKQCNGFGQRKFVNLCHGCACVKCYPQLSCVYFAAPVSI